MRIEPIKIYIGNNGTILYYVYLDGGRIEVIHDVEKDRPDPPVVQLIVIDRIIELRKR